VRARLRLGTQGTSAHRRPPGSDEARPLPPAWVTAALAAVTTPPPPPQRHDSRQRPVGAGRSVPAWRGPKPGTTVTCDANRPVDRQRQARAIAQPRVSQTWEGDRQFGNRSDRPWCQVVGTSPIV
jgi:hypothetical protein